MKAEPSVVAVGYFGSYARGDWGVGSNVARAVRAAGGAVGRARLPVPADVLVYTRAEWERLSARPREVVRVSGRAS